MTKPIDLQTVRATLRECALIGFDGIVEAEARRTAPAKIGIPKPPVPGVATR